MELHFKPGDVVTATVAYPYSDLPRDRPYTVTGVVYELPDYPDSLWVGRDLIVHNGTFDPWITVFVSAPEPVSA